MQEEHLSGPAEPLTYLPFCTGWTSVSNTQETRYPAQVKVKVLEQCAAMPER